MKLNRTVGMTLTFLLVSLTAFYFFSRPSIESKPKSPESDRDRSYKKGLFSFQKLPEDTVSQYETLVFKEDLFEGDPILNSLKEEELELLIVSFLHQFSKQIQSSGKVEFFFNPPQRPLMSLLNQYGIDTIKEDQVSFLAENSKGVAKIGNRTYGRSDLNEEKYYWGAYHSRVFRRKLDLIEAAVVKNLLSTAARQEKLNLQEYTSQYVYGKDQPLVFSDPKVREFVSKNLVKKSIAFDIELPDFSVELKPDWSPSLGNLESPMAWVVFDSFYSESGRDFIKNIKGRWQKYPQVTFYFHPVFAKTDRFQNLLAEFSFCIWALQPDHYWDFLGRAIDVPQKSFEKDVYAIVADLGLPKSPIQQCFYEQKYKNVVQYHLDYASFLGIQSGPVIFFRGEVHTGFVSVDDLL